MTIIYTHTIHSTPADGPLGFHWEGTPSPSCTGGKGRVSKQLTIKLAIKLIATSNNCTAQTVVATDMLHA